jgi:hypothetical protein
MSKIITNQGFLLFLLVDGRIRVRTNNDGSGSERPKNIQIRIHNANMNFYLLR